jgi:hypothetical protein
VAYERVKPTLQAWIMRRPWPTGAVASWKKKNNLLMYLLPQEQFHMIASCERRFLLSVESITWNLKQNDKFALLCHKYRCLTCCGMMYDISFCTQAYVEPTARSICVRAQCFVSERQCVNCHLLLPDVVSLSSVVVCDFQYNEDILVLNRLLG